MFSVLTPTYNRAKELPRVYESLMKQAYTDFEWIISDDGGTDQTGALVQEWQNKNPHFKITYHALEKNMGKSFAVNEGLALCQRPYTLIADSDDTFEATTLDDLKTIWQSVEKTSNSEKIGAIWTLVQDEQGQLVGEPWPKDFWQVGFEERVLNRKQPIKGEKWHCWRTEVLQKYKMYVNANSHISPGVTWNKINKDYDFLCVNVIHRTYWFTEDGIIHQKKSKLKIEKRNYYSSLFTLRNIRSLKILEHRFYRKAAFDYIKSSFYYSDTELKLMGTKKCLAWLSFLLIVPKRVFGKVFNSH